MVIGETHEYRIFEGRLYRQCYRNKWLEVVGEPLDWRYYETEVESDFNRRFAPAVDTFYAIRFLPDKKYRTGV